MQKQKAAALRVYKLGMSNVSVDREEHKVIHQQL